MKKQILKEFEDKFKDGILDTPEYLSCLGNYHFYEEIEKFVSKSLDKVKAQTEDIINKPKNRIKGYISIADFRNIDKLAKYEEGIEVFTDKKTAKGAMPKGTRIVECELIIKQK